MRRRENTQNRPEGRFRTNPLWDIALHNGSAAGNLSARQDGVNKKMLIFEKISGIRISENFSKTGKSVTI